MTQHSRYELPSITGGMAVQGTSPRQDRAGAGRPRTAHLRRSVCRRATRKVAHKVWLAAEREMRSQIEQLQARVQRLDAIINSLARPLDELDPEVEDQLLQLALTIGRHLVRHELRIDPSQVIAIIRETVALLPASARDVRVHLHPEDAAVVREKLAAPVGERVVDYRRRSGDGAGRLSRHYRRRRRSMRAWIRASAVSSALCWAMSE